MTTSRSNRQKIRADAPNGSAPPSDKDELIVPEFSPGRVAIDEVLPPDSASDAPAHLPSNLDDWLHQDEKPTTDSK